jgi:hypothetical protein
MATSKSRKKFSLLLIGISKENLEIPQQLRSIVDHIRIFDNVEDCEQILQLLDEDRFILVTNGQCGRDIVPCIHDLSQVCSIYIFDVDQIDHQQWINDYSKVSIICFK